MSAPLTREEKDTAEKLKLVLKVNRAARFEMYGAIKPKVGPIVKSPELRANYLQRLESEVVQFCLLNEIPIRIIKLKPRQKGSSTFSVWNGYCMGSDSRCNGAIIGSTHKQGENLMNMLETYANSDSYNPKNKCRVISMKADWANGSMVDQLTAKNKEAGRSGTYQWLIVTEPARWSEDGVANAGDVLAGLLKCVADAPFTMIELESTANGATGEFYERWQGAITLEDLKAGKRGYVKIFAAWWQFEDSRRNPVMELGKEQCVPRDKVAEVRLKFGLDDWQLAWMQWACREECKKDFDVFCEEYPFDAESAFRTSGRRRFNTNKLQAMVERATQFHPQFGTIDSMPDGTRAKVVWRPTPSDECRVMRWEQPKPGARYLISIDSMTGETQVGGKDPDNHAVGVLKAGMIQEGVGWVPPRLVARLLDGFGEWERNRRYTLRWDIDVLAEQAFRLAMYYGNCLIVPEMNMDRGLVELLKQMGANIYQRELFNQREQITTKAYGWMTDVRTREMIIENLARAIREQGKPGEGVDIFCPITLAEMMAFIVRTNGRSEAMPGAKDDTVLQTAIGLMCVNAATTFVEPRVEVKLPRELALLEKMERGSGNGGMAMKW